MRSPALVASTLSLLLPAAALACGGEPGTYYEHYGTAVFAAGGEITAISPNHDDVYDWVAIDAQSQRSGRGTIDVMPAMESSGPRIRLGNGDVFALVGGQLFRVNESTSVRTPVLGGVYSFDLAGGDLLVTSGANEAGTAQLEIHRDTAFGERRKLSAVASVEAGCDVYKLAIGRFANGAVAGLCGDAPFRLDGDVLTIEPSLGLGAIGAVESAGVGADGALTFFATTPEVEDPWSSRIVAIRRTPEGAWSAETIATLPISEIADGRLAVASPDAGAVAGWSDSYSLPMHAFRRVDGGWVTEEIATVYPNDRVAVRMNGSAMTVLAGGFSLRSFEQNEDGTWTSTSHGDIGMNGVVGGGPAGGCSISGAPAASPGAALVTMALLVLGLVVARNRSR